MKIYFTADLHLDHANIIKYANRPFLKQGDLIGEGQIDKKIWASEKIKSDRCHWMNKTLIDNINKKVSEDDLLYNIGDFAFKGINNSTKWENKIKCRVVHITGNHDRNNGIKSYIIKCMMEFGGKEVFVQHNPPLIKDEIPICDFVICGHVHDKWKHKYVKDCNIPIINVGIDVWEYEPVSTHALLKYYDRLKNETRQN